MLSPPEEPHDFSGDGQTNESGAVPKGDDKCSSQLPSAGSLGRESPVSVFHVETFDFAAVVENDPTIATFLEDCCYEEPLPTAVEEELDDNHDLDIDCGDSCGDSYSSELDELFSSSSNVSPAGLPWSSPEISEHDLLVACMNQVDPASRALYAMEMKMQDTGMCRNMIYRRMREKEAILRDTGAVRGHIDNGAMVSTTNDKTLLWHIRKVLRPPALKVADSYQHFPTHEGYLRLPTESVDGYHMVRCYFTPTLDATIISPDAFGRDLGCRGYTSVSNFDGIDCRLTLHHCRRRSEDVEIALTLIRGLLYSEPLLRPADDVDRYKAMPKEVLMVRKVSKFQHDPSHDLCLCDSCKSQRAAECDASTVARDNTKSDDASDSSSIATERDDTDFSVLLDTPASADTISPLVETVLDNDDDDDATVPADVAIHEIASSPLVETVLDDNDAEDDDDARLDTDGACGCAGGKSCACEASLPTPSVEEPLSSDLAEKLLYHQRLGCQTDILLESLHEHADGVPKWSSDCPSVCGHDSTIDDADAVCTCAPVSDSNEDATQYMEYGESYELVHLSRSQQRLLWHQRLGHTHYARVAKMHQHAEGVPRVPIATELDTCPVCAHAKLRKANRGKDSTRRATQCNQGISVDTGFMVQASSADSGRVKRLMGLNGETCYVLITCHHSGKLYGGTFRSKAPAIDYLNRWLLHHGLAADVADKYVRLDRGGDLGGCREVVDLFENAGYKVEPTAPGSSHQNGPGERPHQTISDALRTMLAGAALPPKFWPYAFHHYIRLYNVTPHADRGASPFEICSGGLKPNLRHLRVFGCRVYAMPTHTRKDCLVSDSRVGIFLGFTKTMKNILYYDTDTETVKEAQHVTFDESMNDLDVKPPNARLLDGIRDQDPDVLNIDVPLPNLDVSTRAFTDVKTFTFSVDLWDDAPLGLEFDTCSRLRRAFVSRVLRSPVDWRGIKSFRNRFKGAYVVSVDDEPVFSVDDIDKAIDQLRSSKSPPGTITVELAPERVSDADDRPSPLHLRINDLRHICALQSVAGEGMSAAEYESLLSEFASDMSPAMMTAVIHRLQSQGMTPEEVKLKKFTRHQLKKLPNWPTWDICFDSQLDGHDGSGTFLPPVPRSSIKSEDGTPPNILRMHWNNVVKPDGTRKCRCCLDGSKRAAPWLRQFVQTYASCVEQPCMRMFYALCAVLGLVVTFADTTNAYQQSPPPSKQCYLEIDDAYRSWHRKRYGTDVDPKTHVVPLGKALQGHPEAGVLWETMIVGILEGEELGFKATTHERNLYRGEIDGEIVLVCRQVDDFSIGSKSSAAAEKLIAVINKHAATESQGIGVVSKDGMSARYNGIDVHQTQDYIKLTCETYIDRVLKTHGWETPGAKESDRHDSVPMSADTSKQLGMLSGPVEGSGDHVALEKEMGFSYRQVLGEVIYAYVVGRLDIGYAGTFLSRFASAPHRAHYKALKDIVKYLRRTKDWGLVYWREKPVKSLPQVPLPEVKVDPSLPQFPVQKLSQLVGYIDAAHATDLKTRRSVTGYVFCLAGGAIAFKSKLQPTVATSSTEAEFTAGVSGAKVAKYLRSVLSELGYAQEEPTPLYMDNQAAIAMINERKPTTRSRHIDIQHFAIQEWRQRGDIIMHHIPGIVNPSDQATKALGWTLHSRHVRRSMGHHRPRL